jgi:uncharacterized protein DUF6011
MSRPVRLPASIDSQLPLSERLRNATRSERTARCGRCGRTLRDPRSVEGELGPVCRAKREAEAR